jgi:hypothetical protein
MTIEVLQEFGTGKDKANADLKGRDGNNWMSRGMSNNWMSRGMSNNWMSCRMSNNWMSRRMSNNWMSRRMSNCRRLPSSARGFLPKTAQNITHFVKEP